MGIAIIGSITESRLDVLQCPTGFRRAITTSQFKVIGALDDVDTILNVHPSFSKLVLGMDITLSGIIF